MKNNIKEICKELNLENYIIKRMANGLANKVYKITNKDNKYVLKKYVQIKNNKLSESLQKYCLEVNIPIPRVIRNGIYEDTQWILLEYIEGRHVFKINDSHITEIINIINKFHKINLNKIKFEIDLIEKVETFYQYLKEKEKYKIKNQYIINILKLYEEKIKKRNNFSLSLAHGDLSPTNIIWNKNKIKGIIDFDEAIIAPINYDFIVVMMKFCFKKNNINVELAKKIIEKYKIKNNKYNKESLEKTLYLYIIKVILEKLYLYEKNIIDIYDKRQKEDSWKNWYEILINKDLIEGLF